MINTLLAKVFGTKNDREVKRLLRAVEKTNQLEPQMQALSTEEIPVKTQEFKDRVAKGATLNSILPEAFALAREAGKRSLNMRHFDVQLAGGMVLHEGKIAEMKTGEGKTLVATLALYLNSLAGKGAHLVTVNDYLAKRDAEWMMPLYNMLGVSVGIIQHDMSDEARKEAYQCDITYGTNSEFGFEYLRDNMKFDLAQYVQRDLHYAIVDEVDSILIDEARTPLIISGAAEKGGNLYVLANQAVMRLHKETDYEVDEKARSVHPTESGNDKIEKMLGVENLYAPEHTLILHHVSQALRAHAIFKKDVDYVVRENEVLIVDEFTGRIMSGRRYSDGLHQALEAKEGVRIERENQTVASITLQNYFRMYTKLAGMTGTAQTEAEEFHRIYKLGVVSIPTNKPVARVDEPDAILLDTEDKFEAILEDIEENHKLGRPILVGTVAVETSELLGQFLQRKGIPHNILNAKQHAREADIVAEAGQPGKITIATNMAGRGTDIKLTPESLEAGGLRIIGTERHESRRIDNQLRGRSGRQGDPGSSKFYLSLDDNLIRIFGGERIKNLMMRWGMEKGERIEHKMISRNIESAQERVEKQHFESRKHVLEYDDVMNQQRKVVYAYRRDVLEGGQVTGHIIDELIADVVASMCAIYVAHKAPTKEELADLHKSLEKLTGMAEQEVVDALSKRSSHDPLEEFLTIMLRERYAHFRQQIDTETIQNAEKWLLLQQVDNHWKIHLHVIDSLKEGINLRSYGQKNPLLEYKKESFKAFTNMMDAIKWDSVAHLFRIRPEHFSESHIHELEKEREKELESITEAGGDDASQGETSERRSDKVGRNEPCPCESGKKYKQCCGKRG